MVKMVENVDENGKVLTKQSQSQSRVMRLMSQMGPARLSLHTALLTVGIIVLLSASLSVGTSE